MNAIIALLKQRYNEETHNIYNTDKIKPYDINNNIYTDEHYYNKAQNVNNNITNNISKHTSNNEHVLKLEHAILLKTISATIIHHILLKLNIIYIKGLVLEHSITQITYLEP